MKTKPDVSGRRHVGVAEVRASFDPPNREPISLAFFARPLANLITPMIFNIGVTADQVILARLFIGLLALVLLALGGFWTSLAGLIAFSFAYILDCVDGNISRLDDSGNYWGKFIDGFADDIVLFSTPFAIGIGLYGANNNITPKDNNGNTGIIQAKSTGLTPSSLISKNKKATAKNRPPKTGNNICLFRSEDISLTLPPQCSQKL